ncbi:MAG: cytochrome c-type biogenesis protein [Betaproteobacteria bacterium]
MRKSMFALLALMLLAAGGVTQASDAVPTAANPALEKRVMALSEELRCLVCQNQTIAESHAGLAVDLKNQIREQMAAGKSDQAILDYMVARYGDFVLYRPPVKATTVLLWFGPFALLAGAIGFLLYNIRRRRTMLLQKNNELTDSQRARAQQLINDGTAGGNR